MPEITLTPQQQAALSHDRHIVVTAGAGTGKTEVLIQRYLRLLSHPDVQHIHQILALTFTDKAAGEMRHRVYRALLESVRQLDRPADERIRFRKLLDQFHANHISTIDAFFSSVVQRFPYEIPELAPDFTILQGYRQRELLRQALESTLDGIACNPEHPSYEALRRLLQGRNRRALFEIVQRCVMQRHLLSGWFQAWESRSDETMLAEWQVLITQASETALAEIREAVVEPVSALQEISPKKPSRSDAAIKTREQIFRGLEGSPEELADALFTQTGVRSFNKGTKAVWGDDKPRVNELFAEISQHALPHRTRLEMQWEALLEERAVGDLRVLAEISQLAIEEYQRHKLAQAALDFVDLQLYASRILDNPDILRQYQHQFRYIMIDEFQDTNRIQWAQLMRLAGDPDRPGEYCPDKLFVVGDEKQAIYRFRGGEVEVYEQAKRFIAEQNRKNGRLGPYPTTSDVDLPTDGRLEFSLNFRSELNLLLFFNQFFEPLLAKHRDYEAEAQMLAYRDGRVPDCFQPDQGTVEIWRFGAEVGDEQEMASDVLEARCIAARLREILDGKHESRYPELREQIEARERAVGMLFRRRTKQTLYEQALREFDVLYVVAGGRGFYLRQEILDLANALWFLAHPYLDLPLVGVLRSPLFALSDSALVHIGIAEGDTFLSKLHALALEPLSPADQQAVTKARALLDHWREAMSYLRPSELLLQILDTSGVLAPLSYGSDGQQRLHNVYKLVDLARQFEQESSALLTDFVEFLHAQITDEEEEGEAELPEGGGVQLMTVHQSKGLEFPLVILPDTLFSFRDEQGMLIDYLDDRVQVGWMCARDDGPNQPSALHRLMQARIREANVAEEKRLLYVACTRAERHLWLTLREPRENREPASLETGKRWSDWIWLRLQDPHLGWVMETPA